ncbi:MAG: UDP-2,3-diacylglucosamine diphosphatase LpxI, partial [Acidobacteriota bacterium]|nr:UDP-2,3-diacylglucosamine diphosphatase LpxI [Acidobacteriota bacterium]
MNAPRYAIIAGNGRFPFLVLEAAKEQGIDPVIFAIKEEAAPGLSQSSSSVHWLSLGELAKLLELLAQERIEKIILAGQVKHAQLYSSIKPDAAVRSALTSLDRKNTNALIGVFVKMVEDLGMEVIDSTAFLKPLLADAGVMTPQGPDASGLADIEYGREVAKQLAALDIGQTVVVADRACLAVEAMEGTDA